MAINIDLLVCQHQIVGHSAACGMPHSLRTVTLRTIGAKCRPFENKHNQFLPKKI